MEKLSNIDSYILNKKIPNDEKNAMLLCYLNHHKFDSSFSLFQLVDLSLRLDNKKKRTHASLVPRRLDLDMELLYLVFHVVPIIYVLSTLGFGAKYRQSYQTY